MTLPAYSWLFYALSSHCACSMFVALLVWCCLLNYMYSSLVDHSWCFLSIPFFRQFFSFTQLSGFSVMDACKGSGAEVSWIGCRLGRPLVL